MGKLNGKIALITGGNSGIGLATAQAFITAGAYVFVTGRRQTELDRAKQLLGENATIVQGDVANLEDLDRLYAVIAAQKGKLDIVVVNAAVVELASISQVTPELFDKIFTINARGAFFTAQKSLPLMNDGGSIVMVSSVGYLIGAPGYTVYAATKGAMRSFVRSLAAELTPRRIRVNSISPGPVDTPILESIYGEKADKAREDFASRVPMRRVGRSEEIAAGIVFLASDDSSFTTGFDLVADGGLTQF